MESNYRNTDSKCSIINNYHYLDLKNILINLSDNIYKERQCYLY